MSAAIDVRGLTKRYDGRAVVDDFAITVERGQIFGFLGPNGSGKTTTIRMLCGLLTPDAGEGTCLGYDIRTEAPAIKREVGYMTQRFSLYEDLSIEENLDFVARMYGVPQRKEAVAHSLDRLGLAARRAQLAGTLSGGERQMLALGRALMSEPKLLMLDEPSLGLAPAVVEALYDMLQRLHKEGLTLLLAEQSIPLVLGIADYAYVLQTGRIALQGKASELENNQQVREIYLGISARAASAGLH
jgi:ABC-2 type transport system ATP-binding protein